MSRKKFIYHCFQNAEVDLEILKKDMALYHAIVDVVASKYAMAAVSISERGCQNSEKALMTDLNSQLASPSFQAMNSAAH